jgi:hypothetical protein
MRKKLKILLCAGMIRIHFIAHLDLYWVIENGN